MGVWSSVKIDGDVVGLPRAGQPFTLNPRRNPSRDREGAVQLVQR